MPGGNSHEPLITEEVIKAYLRDKTAKWRWVAKPGACSQCQALDGKVMTFDEILERPHPNCKCTLKLHSPADPIRTDAESFGFLDGLRHYTGETGQTVYLTLTQNQVEDIIDYMVTAIPWKDKVEGHIYGNFEYELNRLTYGRVNVRYRGDYRNNTFTGKLSVDSDTYDFNLGISDERMPWKEFLVSLGNATQGKVYKIEFVGNYPVKFRIPQR